MGEGPLNLGQVLYLPKDELGNCEVHSTPKKKVIKVVAEFLPTGVPTLVLLLLLLLPCIAPIITLLLDGLGLGFRNARFVRCCTRSRCR